MNTLMLFGTATAATVTGAAALPFVMHRLEGGLSRVSVPPEATQPAAPTTATAVLEPGPGLPQPDAA